MKFLCYLLGVIVAMFSIFWFSNGEWRAGILFLVLGIPIFFVPTIFERINTPKRKTLKTNGELFEGFRKEEDEMEGHIQYFHPKCPKHYSFNSFGTRLILDVFFTMSGKNNYFTFLRFCYQYQNKRFFINQIILKTDSKRYKYTEESGRHSSQNGSITSFIEISTMDLDTNMLKDLATSQTLKVRLKGVETYMDFDFSSQDKRCFILDAYEAWRGAIEKNPNMVCIYSSENKDCVELEDI